MISLRRALKSLLASLGIWHRGLLADPAMNKLFLGGD